MRPELDSAGPDAGGPHVQGHAMHVAHGSSSTLGRAAPPPPPKPPPIAGGIAGGIAGTLPGGGVHDVSCVTVFTKYLRERRVTKIAS